MEKILISTLALVGVLTLASPIANAEDIETEKNANTEFSLIPNDDPGEAIRIEGASNLRFDPKMIAAEEITSTVISSTVIINEFSGQAPGWKLKAKASPLTFEVPAQGEQPKKTVTLTGAQIKLPVAEYEKLETTSAAASPNPSTAKALNTSNQILVEAAPGSAYGRWQMNYYNVGLVIPAGNIAGDYTGSITYTIESTPIAEDAGE